VKRMPLPGLVRGYSQKLRCAAWRVVRNCADAEDVVQVALWIVHHRDLSVTKVKTGIDRARLVLRGTLEQTWRGVPYAPEPR
jgi:hypothetical protein